MRFVEAETDLLADYRHPQIAAPGPAGFDRRYQVLDDMHSAALRRPLLDRTMFAFAEKRGSVLRTLSVARMVGEFNKDTISF